MDRPGFWAKRRARAVGSAGVTRLARGTPVAGAVRRVLPVRAEWRVRVTWVGSDEVQKRGHLVGGFPPDAEMIESLRVLGDLVRVGCEFRGRAGRRPH